jgi:aryl-alcohol dehydrogenase-like predicted oxidoreductase
VDRTDPGHTKLHRLEENIGAASVALTANDMGEIEEAAAKVVVEGARGTGREKHA